MSRSGLGAEKYKEKGHLPIGSPFCDLWPAKALFTATKFGCDARTVRIEAQWVLWTVKLLILDIARIHPRSSGSAMNGAVSCRCGTGIRFLHRKTKFMRHNVCAILVAGEPGRE